MKTPENEELISLRRALSEAESAYREHVAKRSGDLKEFTRVHDVVLNAQRKLALALGDEAAIPWVLPFRATSLTAIKLADGYRTILIFEARTPSSKTATAVLDFVGALATQHGWPNDEVIDGHRLNGKGLSAYGSYEVRNSKLIHELERRNSIHPNHKPEHYDGYKHYILSFKDETIEIVASKVSHEIFEDDVMSVVPKILGRLHFQ